MRSSEAVSEPLSIHMSRITVPGYRKQRHAHGLAGTVSATVTVAAGHDCVDR